MSIARILRAAVLAVSSISASAAAAEPNSLIITGASTIAPLITEVAHRYEEKHPGVRIDVQSGGSSRGVADVRKGIADIGMVSRNLKPDEADLRPFPIARDGVGVIVNAKNKVAALSREQVIGIYTGEIANWAKLGGSDQPITVVTKAEGRSTLEVFLDHLKLQPAAVKAHVVIGDNEQGVKTVTGNPGAIGYVSVGTAEYHAHLGTPIRLLPLGAVAATTDNVANGSYGATRTLHLVTAKEPQGLTADFIAYAASPEVHDLIREQYFVPIRR